MLALKIITYNPAGIAEDQEIDLGSKSSGCYSVNGLGGTIRLRRKAWQSTVREFRSGQAESAGLSRAKYQRLFALRQTATCLRLPAWVIGRRFHIFLIPAISRKQPAPGGQHFHRPTRRAFIAGLVHGEDEQPGGVLEGFQVQIWGQVLSFDLYT